MIKIETLSDFQKFNTKKINPLITEYIRKYFLFICRQYKSPDLSQVGAIFYLNGKNDLNKYEKTGLSLPFDRAIYETSDLLTLDDGRLKITIFQVIYLLSNDIAVTVIFGLKCLDELTKSWLSEDCTERTVYL